MPRLFGWLSTIVLLAFVATLYALRPQPLVAAGLIFPILTVVFITSSCVVVTYVAIKAYARERLLSVLFLGCGALVFGCTSLIAAEFLQVEGQDFSATMIALGAVVSAAFHFVCASLTYLGGTSKTGGRRQAYLWLAFASISVGAIFVAALAGVLPVFYAPGTGTTLVDRVALGIASVTFAASSAIIFAVFSVSRSAVLYWYSLAMAATAAGLVGVAFSDGDMTALAMRGGWATMYLGGVLLATSVLSAERLGLRSGKEN